MAISYGAVSSEEYSADEVREVGVLPKGLRVRSVVSNSLRPRGLQPTRLLWPWDSPGQNTGVGCHALLQEISPTQRLNLVSHIAGGLFTS